MMCPSQRAPKVLPHPLVPANVGRAHIFEGSPAHSLEADSDDDSEEVQETPFMWKHLVVDDNDASVVIVLPKLPSDNGNAADWKNIPETIEDPLDKARKIFNSQQSTKDVTEGEGFNELRDVDEVSLEAYQSVVRQQLLRLLRRSGFKLKSFTSTDGDEVFLKVSLKRDGEVIRQLACAYGYPMPFKEGAYENMHGVGSHPARRPMKNSLNVVATAHLKYKQDNELSRQFKEFRGMDEIRLIERRLRKWVNVEEMMHQMVISKWFPAIQHQNALRLGENWANPFRVYLPPFEVTGKGFTESHEVTSMVRDYFGEEIAFFFHWFAFYTEALVPLTLVWVAGTGFWHIALEDNKDNNSFCYYQIAWALVLVIWATNFHKLYKNRAERVKQIWGVPELLEFESVSFERPEYNPDMSDWQEKAWVWGTNAALMAFGAGFIAAVGWLESVQQAELRSGPHKGLHVAGLVQAFLIRATSFLWGKFAKFLVDRQNHRTYESWNDQLTFMVSVGKLSFTIYPFLKIGFNMGWGTPKGIIHKSLNDAAKSIWTGDEFPAFALNELEANWLVDHNGKANAFQVTHCHPVKPPENRQDLADCRLINCWNTLNSQLSAFWLYHFVSVVGFMLVPILLTKISLMRESWKSRGETPSTLLQYQAKTCDNAPYEFDSWGGSRVDDFLELASSFALLVCFGQVNPTLTVFGLFFNLIVYRLFAYRMTFVTCRPFPRCSNGIGSWQLIFEYISNGAVLINALLVVWFVYPVRTWDLRKKMLLFIVLEHTFFGLRFFISGLLPDVPFDVTRIRIFNAQFLLTLTNPKLKADPHDQCQCTDADIGLALTPQELAERRE